MKEETNSKYATIGLSCMILGKDEVEDYNLDLMSYGYLESV